jgi:hypothetical protein
MQLSSIKQNEQIESNNLVNVSGEIHEKDNSEEVYGKDNSDEVYGKENSDEVYDKENSDDFQLNEMLDDRVLFEIEPKKNSNDNLKRELSTFSFEQVLNTPKK